MNEGCRNALCRNATYEAYAISWEKRCIKEASKNIEKTKDRKEG